MLTPRMLFVTRIDLNQSRFPSFARLSHAALALVAVVLIAGCGTIKSEQDPTARSEEHTSELQSLVRISYAVFCLKKTKNQTTHTNTTYTNQKTKPIQTHQN